MSGTFVPLFSERPAHEFHAVPALQPVTTAPSPTDVTSTEISGIACGAAVKREPVLELIRDGGRVSHLKITCGCGEVITIECQFEGKL